MLFQEQKAVGKGKFQRPKEKEKLYVLTLATIILSLFSLTVPLSVSLGAVSHVAFHASNHDEL